MGAVAAGFIREILLHVFCRGRIAIIVIRKFSRRAKFHGSFAAHEPLVETAQHAKQSLRFDPSLPERALGRSRLMGD